MVRHANRIKRLWSLLRAGSADGKRLRQRLGAGGALATLLAGLLTAVGLGIVVLALVVLLCCVIAVAAAVVALAAHGPSFRGRSAVLINLVKARGHDIGAAGLQLGGLILARARLATRSVRSRAPDVAAAGSEMTSIARRQLASAGRSMVANTRAMTNAPQRNAVPHSETAAIHRQREGLRLNAAGTKLRREGFYADAVELHTRALEVLRELGDRRAMALTLNNLALALSHIGREVEAIELFEEAAGILRELGDGEHEGRVIANLGLTHRRHGRREEADDVLELALTKLTPTSSAYRRVEAELRRAS